MEHLKFVVALALIGCGGEGFAVAEKVASGGSEAIAGETGEGGDNVGGSAGGAISSAGSSFNGGSESGGTINGGSSNGGTVNVGGSNNMNGGGGGSGGAVNGGSSIGGTSAGTNAGGAINGGTGGTNSAGTGSSGNEIACPEEGHTDDRDRCPTSDAFHDVHYQCSAASEDVPYSLDHNEFNMKDKQCIPAVDYKMERAVPTQHWCCNK